MLFLKYSLLMKFSLMQDHVGISNVAPADCPLIPLLAPEVDQSEEGAVDKTRIHDHISNLRFSLSPTAFFQVCLNCKPLCQLSFVVNFGIDSQVHRLILLLQKDCTPLLVIGPISIRTHYFLMYAVGLEQLA